MQACKHPGLRSSMAIVLMRVCKYANADTRNSTAKYESIQILAQKNSMAMVMMRIFKYASDDPRNSMTIVMMRVCMYAGDDVTMQAANADTKNAMANFNDENEVAVG